MQRLRIIANDVQAAALGRPFGAERGDDDVASGADRASDLSHIRDAIGGIGEEVKDRPVMPNVESTITKGKRPDITA